ncbi:MULTISPECIES: ATP-binding protein [unclassified Virgibacillus]|uniref:ATP-binding protein n=1 Tax=unclassified Virgibacillus TaxID=2620237 RepID=UPI00090AC9CC|nr:MULTISPECIES: ATP-binding protein [unclassified Virgibacillus]API92685.1 DnaC replication protein [Virgibacillus sp. 6R]MBS7428179.1 ATP-binding protein [Virgibacillus sp. 19R1-5]
MERIKIVKPKERFIKKYICTDCDQEVERKELQITGGPNKGKWETFNFGCKCEDKKLGKQAKALQKKLKQEKMKKFFDYYSLINNSLQEATIENYKPTSNDLANAKQAVIDYVNEFDGEKNLLLTGTYGTGKSHLSVAITKELMKQGKECLFLSLPKLLTKIKETYNSKDVTEEELLDVIKRVDLLVLDDIGAEHQTGWVKSKLFEILDDRAGKSTVYTTNLDSVELKETVNERNFSRMMENTKVIVMDGSDYRRRGFE